MQIIKHLQNLKAKLKQNYTNGKQPGVISFRNTKLRKNI